MRARLPRRLVGSTIVGLVALLGLTAACSSGSQNHCSYSSCRGTIHGSKFDIRMPKHWNGTLLLFSHGYVNPAGNAPPTAQISYGDRNGLGMDGMSSTLLGQGYALAGSSYTGKGWVAKDAVNADSELYNKFVALRGTPKRTIVWGASFGGLITELVAEKYSWVDGALPICGVLAGPALNFDNFLESAWLVKTLLDPSLRLTAFTSQQQATAAALEANAAIGRAATDLTGGGAAKVVLIGDILGVPRKWPGSATGREKDQLRSLVAAEQYYTVFNFAARYDIERRYGGNPSSTYVPPVPLTAFQDSEITKLHGDAAALLAKIRSAAPVVADPSARQAFEASGNPTGKLRVPTVTLHTTQDTIVLAPNETIFQNRVAAHGQTGRLLQLQVDPPAKVASPAYGVGHCVFSSQQVLGALDVLLQWVDTGKQPATTAVTSMLGPNVTRAAALPAWPSGATR